MEAESPTYWERHGALILGGRRNQTRQMLTSGWEQVCMIERTGMVFFSAIQGSECVCCPVEGPILKWQHGDLL